MNMVGKSRYTILFIIILVLVVSCINKNTLNYKIADYLQNECQFNADTSIIDINDFTDFDWDVMYTFAEMNPPEAIVYTIGIEYLGEGANYNTELILFIKDDKVVYEERRTEGSGLFYFLKIELDTINNRAFYNGQPFYVRRTKQDNGKYSYVIFQR